MSLFNEIKDCTNQSKSLARGDFYNPSVCPCEHSEQSHLFMVEDINRVIVICEDCSRYSKCVG